MKVAIAGSGIMGLFTAYYLNRKGVEVVVLERGDGPAGASLGNAGMIVPSHFTPLAAPGVLTQSLKWLFDKNSPFSITPSLKPELLAWGWQFIRASRKDIPGKRKELYQLNSRSRELYAKLMEEEDFDIGFQPKGLIMYCKTEKALHEEKELIKVANKLGQEARFLNPAQAAELDPGLDLDVLGAVYYPNDAFLAPHLMIGKLVDLLIERGVVFVNGQGLDDIEVDGDRIAGFISGNEYIIADEYVIATGAWSNSWKKKLSLNLPLMAGKGYSFTLSKPPKLPEICSILVEARVAVTPMNGDLRFGGTMEIAGLNTHINQTKLQGIKNAIPQYFPEISPSQLENLDTWYGFRPCSPDGLPYIGRTQKIRNLSIATGHAMMGLSLGPVTGEMISETISLKRESGPYLSPDRF